VTPPLDNDGHDCGWKHYAKAQEAKLAELTAKLKEVESRLAALAQRTRGNRSERRQRHKMPAPLKPSSDPAETAQKRQQTAALWGTTVETQVVPLPVPKEQCRCPECGNTELRRVGQGKPSTVYEYVQPHFRRKIYRRETLSCRCGYIVTAKAPERVGEKTRYSPSFVAHLVVSKCSDSIPQYRLEKAYRNVGIPMSRSTMCDLFHRAAEELRPLHTAALALVPAAADVHADETSMRQQGLRKKTYLWDFITPDLIVYRYALSRSGDTPKQVLGDSTGRLVVDQHTGYNAVTRPGRRLRAGCLAHARRKIYEQHEHPETKEALDLIGELYLVEREAKKAAITGTADHLALRQQRSRGLFARLLRWGHRHKNAFDPSSGMGRAIRYLLRNFRELGRFLRHASLPPDNNVAEAALRRVALGRSNFLFVGHENAGHDLAVLYTLVASCEKHRLNPIAYLTDVLVRIQTHPAARVEELLPHRYKPLERSPERADLQPSLL
jgi:transposase